MSKDPACGNTPALSRRTLLAALPASGAALAATQLAQAQAPDPMLPLYHEWLAARREWYELAKLPGNGNWDDPRSLAAQDRESTLEDEMLALTPTTMEGVGALAALAWVYISPSATEPEQFANEVTHYECQAVLAIWRACTGNDGYPVT